MAISIIIPTPEQQHEASRDATGYNACNEQGANKARCNRHIMSNTFNQQVLATPVLNATRANHDIEEKYGQLGGPNSFVGQPITDVHVCPDGIGYFRAFQHGSIYWTPATGAHVVQGAIRDEWAALGWEQSFLGYPLMDETGTPDDIGRFTAFQGGSIYWTPATGAHEVHGAIRDKWESLGWERFFLGYLTTDETDFAEGGRASVFERGAISWWPDVGAIADEPYAVLGVVCANRQRVLP